MGDFSIPNNWDAKDMLGLGWRQCTGSQKQNSKGRQFAGTGVLIVALPLPESPSSSCALAKTGSRYCSASLDQLSNSTVRIDAGKVKPPMVLSFR
ncbi:MAG: hypothetical protein U1F63_01755 [Chitinivorax sp.]